MKFKSILVLIALFLSVGLAAQQCPEYYPTQMDEEIEISSYNKKDKLTGYSRQKVVEVGNNEWTIEATNFDPKDEELNTTSFKVKCENGNLKVDMITFVAADVLMPYQGMEMNIEGTYLDFPGELIVGQELADGDIKVEVMAQGGFVLATITTHVTNRKVESLETIETPIGSFECFKISYDVDSKIGFIKAQAKGVEYLSLLKGVIRSESYSKKGKLTGYNVRTK